ncbi:MAG: SURF1 family protein [Woeseia sp.]
MTVRTKTASDFVPPLAGCVLVVLFTSLGFWQLDRAEQKRAVEAAFDKPGEYLPVAPGNEYGLYQPLTASGRYLSERQFLLDNMILDGRVGYFVVTPFEYESGKPLLLVNRGWVAKTTPAEIAATIASETPDSETAPPTAVKGRAGQLPRVGIRAGEAFAGDMDWPRTANWPTLDELARALDRDVLPFVLLADPEPGNALVRRWQPRHVGPMRHIGYAVQWFALAAGVVVLALFLYRQRRAKQ